MGYNLHPIFVHFPIALFVLYSFVRVFPFERWLSKNELKYVYLFLLISGLAGAWLSNITGELAKDLVKPKHSLVEMHESFASFSIWLYAISLVGEVFIFVNEKIIQSLGLLSIKKSVLLLKTIVTNTYFLRILSALGFIAISLTGLLGGIMVYGVSADPLAAPLIKLLGL